MQAETQPSRERQARTGGQLTDGYGPQRDFWPGITSSLPIIRPLSGCAALLSVGAPGLHYHPSTPLQNLVPQVVPDRVVDNLGKTSAQN
jgi:hypothetical protein